MLYRSGRCDPPKVARLPFRTRLADALAGYTAAHESFRYPGYQRERL